MAFNFGSNALFLETLQDYPNDLRVNGGIFSSFYARWYHAYDKGLPKEMHVANVVSVIGFCMYSLLLIVFARNETVALWLGFVYLCAFCVVVLVGYFATYNRAFHKKSRHKDTR